MFEVGNTMIESYWMDMLNGQWLHKCPHFKAELTLGPLRKTCIYSHMGCDAVIPTDESQKKKEESIPNSSWGLKQKQTELFEE